MKFVQNFTMEKIGINDAVVLNPEENFKGRKLSFSMVSPVYGHISLI